MNKLAILFLICGCTTWIPADTHRQIAITALHGIDWVQTRGVVGDDEYKELNPILGSNPTKQEVDLFMAAGLVALTIFPMLTPSKHRPLAQWIFIILKGIVVTNNYRIGARF